MLVKTNPLPPGFYWVDYDPLSAGGVAFRAWLTQNASAVRARATELITPGFMSGIAARVWTLLEVLRAIDWPAATFRFWPNSTPNGAATVKSDIVQTPEPPAPWTQEKILWLAVVAGLAFYAVNQGVKRAFS